MVCVHCVIEMAYGICSHIDVPRAVISRTMLQQIITLIKIIAGICWVKYDKVVEYSVAVEVISHPALAFSSMPR